MRGRQAIPIVVAVVALSARVEAQGPAWAAGVDSIMRAALVRSGAPGGQLAVVQHGRVVFAAGYGLADMESGRPVTDRTLFQVAGVTGLFTAAMVVEMHARGVVDLDAPIRRYLPEIGGPRAGAATLRGLLSMSAGWVNAGNLTGPADQAALSRIFATVGDTIVMADGGQVYSYSNPGINSAGAVAERAGRRPFADLLDSIVFRPLGLTYASYRPAVVERRDFARPYGGAPGQPARLIQPVPANSSEWPTGFLYASAPEIARLAIALMNDGMIDGRRVFRPNAMREMRRAVIPIAEVPGDSDALGMRVAHAGGTLVWEKTGGMPGWESQVTMWPREGIAVVVNLNRHLDLVDQVVEQLAQRVAGIPPRATADLGDAREPTPAERAELVGRYGQTVSTSEYFEQDGRLMVRLGPTTLPVQVIANGTQLVVRPPAGPPRVTAIVRDSEGVVRFLVRDGRAYRKLRPANP